MPKVITIYLTDEEAKEIEKLCEEKGIARYALIKIAIRELCAGALHTHTSLETSHKADNPSVNPSVFNEYLRMAGFKEYLKMAKYECSGCHFPLVKVEGNIKTCPMCGSTKYKEV